MGIVAVRQRHIVLARWSARETSEAPATTVGVVRVVIAEDSFVVRQGLVALLGTEPDIDVVATAETFEEALAAAMEHYPDVVLTDIRMPPTGTDEGIRLAATLRLQAPEIGVVVLSSTPTPPMRSSSSVRDRSGGAIC